MNEKLTEEETWDLIGYIKVSPIRYKTITTIKTSYYMPSEIAKITGFRTTQISNALHDLKEKNLVVCMNENARKGRLYKNTELGLEILEKLE